MIDVMYTIFFTHKFMDPTKSQVFSQQLETLVVNCGVSQCNLYLFYLSYGKLKPLLLLQFIVPDGNTLFIFIFLDLD